MPIGAQLYHGSQYLSEDEERRRQEEELSLLEGTGQTILGGLGFLGAVLDTPGAMVRSAMIGRNPLHGIVNPENRTYGEDMFKAWGIKDHGGWLGEIGLEILTDPTTYLTGGLSALGKTNKATKMLVKSGSLGKIGDLNVIGRSKAAEMLGKARGILGDTVGKHGLVDDAMLSDPSLLSKLARGDTDAIAKIVSGEGAADLTRVRQVQESITDLSTGASRIFTPLETKNLDDWLKMGLDLETNRPTHGIGQRQLKQMLTPSDVLTQDKSGSVRQRFASQLEREGLSTTGPRPKWSREIQEHMNAPLGQHMRFGLGDASIGIHNKRLAKVMDKASEIGRWNPASRELMKLFNVGVRGSRTAELQMWAPDVVKAQEHARVRSRQLVTQLGEEVTQYSQVEQGFSGRVDDQVMRNWFEQASTDDLKDKMAKDLGLSTPDVQLLESHRKLVRTTLDQTFGDMRAAGIDVMKLQDDFTTYFPRRMVKQAFGNNGIDLDVDMIPEFLEQVGAVENRAQLLKGIQGSTRTVQKIMQDPHLNGLLEDAEAIAEQMARLDSAGGGVGSRLELNQLRAQYGETMQTFEKDFFHRHGAQFQNHAMEAKEVVPTYWKDPANRLAAGHAHRFMGWMKNISKDQRRVGLFGHSPIADLEWAIEAAADSISANHMSLDIMAKYAKPLNRLEGSQAISEISSTVGSGPMRAEVFEEEIARTGFKTLRYVMDKLEMRTKVFDDLGEGLVKNGDVVSQQHLVGVRDGIWNRLFPGAMGEEILRQTGRGKMAKHVRGAGMDSHALNDLLDGFVIPNHVAEDLLRMKKVYDAPSRSGIGALWDGYLTLMKTHLTSPFIAFAGRNWLSGQVRNMVIGLWSRKSVRMSHELMTGATVKGASEIPGLMDQVASRGWRVADGNADELATKLLREKVAVHDLMPSRSYAVDPISGQVARSSNVRLEKGLQPIETARAFEAIESPFTPKIAKMWFGFDDVAKERRAGKQGWRKVAPDFFEVEGGVSLGGARKLETHWSPARAGNWMNQWVEGSNRISPFLASLMKGGDEAAAAGRVMGAQVDYAQRKFTRFERHYMQRLFPFYKFRAGQMKWLPSEIAERPGGPIPKIIRSINTMRGRGEFMPDYLAESSATRVPQGIPGISPDDPETNRYLSGFGFMFEDPLQMMPTPRDMVGGPMSAAVSAMHPVPKFLLERAFNRSSFQGGRELDQVSSPVADLLRNLGGVPKSERTDLPSHLSAAPGWLEHMMMQTPLTRYMNTARQITSPIPGLAKGEMGDVLPAAGQLLLGMRPRDVSLATRRAIKQDRATDLLKELTAAKSFEKTYVPMERKLRLMEEGKDVDVKKVIRLEKLLKDMAEEAKQRRVRKLGGKEKAKLKRRAERARIAELEQLLGI